MIRFDMSGRVVLALGSYSLNELTQAAPPDWPAGSFGELSFEETSPVGESSRFDKE